MVDNTYLLHYFSEIQVNTDFFKLKKDTQLGAFLILGFLGFLIYDQVYYWQNREDYSFGFLVPFFVGYVLFERWPIIKEYLLGTGEDKRSYFGGPLMTCTSAVFGLGLVVALLFFALGGVLRVQGPANLASLLIACGFAGFVLGAVYFNTDEDVNGRKLAWKERMTVTLLFLFPALAWLVSAPLVMFMESTVKRVLLGYVTAIVYNVFNFLGFTLIQEGNVLVLPEGRVGVADACSGVRSLTACIFAGTFLAAVFLDRFWKKVLLVGVAMVLAFITNIGRSLFLTGWAYAYGSESIEGTVHDVAGYAVLGVTSILLIALLPIFNFSIAPPDEDDEGDFPADKAPVES